MTIFKIERGKFAPLFDDFVRVSSPESNLLGLEIKISDVKSKPLGCPLCAETRRPRPHPPTSAFPNSAGVATPTHHQRSPVTQIQSQDCYSLPIVNRFFPGGCRSRESRPEFRELPTRVRFGYCSGTDRLHIFTYDTGNSLTAFEILK